MKKKSKNKFKINIKFLYLLYFIPFILYFTTIVSMGVDIWYMLAEAKYIVNNGFPYTDILTFHEGFKLVIQQWLSTLIFYGIHKLIGEKGLILFSFLIFILIEFFLYKLCNLISNNKKTLSILISGIISILLVFFNYLDVRPQLFTFLILIIWIYILEKYNKTNNKKVLFILPLLSILQINLHAAYWWFLFVYSLPFLAEYLYQIVIEKNKKQKSKFTTILIFITISFFCGFINPYGIDSMIYLFNGTNSYVNEFIGEMIPPKIFSKMGIAIVLILFINYIIGIKYYAKHKELKISYLLLLFGSLIISFHAYKSSVFILIFGTYYWAYYLRNIKFKHIIDTKSIKISIIVIIIPIAVTLIGYFTNHIVYGYSASIVTGKDIYSYIVDYNDNHETKVYGSYKIGGYLEYLGIKPYIDTRAEFFLKSHNKKRNVFVEHYDLQHYLLDADVFINTYNFTHLIVDDSDVLFHYDDIEGYTLLDENEYLKLYIRNDLLEEEP